MKTLLLMRHGKSSWKHEHLEDHERQLNKRGKKDVPRMGKLLFDAELVPQRIYSSTAVRARATAEGIVEACEYTGEVFYSDALYLGEPQAYVKTIHSIPDELERILIIGHNPGLETLLQMLVREIESFPTAAIAYLSLPLKKWSELTEQTRAELVNFWRPRDVKK